MKNGFVVDKDGNKFWYLNGKFHRADGPAIEDANGDKHWYLNDNLHRVDGPAVECVDGFKRWYLNDKNLDCKTQEEFEQYMKLKSFW